MTFAEIPSGWAPRGYVLFLFQWKSKPCATHAWEMDGRSYILVRIATWYLIWRTQGAFSLWDERFLVNKNRRRIIFVSHNVYDFCMERNVCINEHTWSASLKSRNLKYMRGSIIFYFTVAESFDNWWRDYRRVRCPLRLAFCSYAIWLSSRCFFIIWFLPNWSASNRFFSLKASSTTLPCNSEIFMLCLLTRFIWRMKMSLVVR